MQIKLEQPVKILKVQLKKRNIRFRPIIMTSLSTMIAMLPLVIGNFGPGAGEGSRLAVGSTILGGMIISTFFTFLRYSNNVSSFSKKY